MEPGVAEADVKYKLTDDGLGRNADYYQLLAYCTALGLRGGVLLYRAENDNEASTAILAASGHQLKLVPLFLGGSGTDLDRSLQGLALRLAADVPARLASQLPGRWSEADPVLATSSYVNAGRTVSTS